MLSDKARDALGGIRINIEAILAFTKAMTFQEFASDLKTFYAVVCALEIISEATRRLPDDLKARHAGIPWRAIRDAGNVYRHRYDSVAASLVWDTVCDQLGPLEAVVARELDDQG